MALGDELGFKEVLPLKLNKTGELIKGPSMGEHALINASQMRFVVVIGEAYSPAAEGQDGGTNMSHVQRIRISVDHS